jgi:hypothetical protein
MSGAVSLGIAAQQKPNSGRKARFPWGSKFPWLERRERRSDAWTELDRRLATRHAGRRQQALNLKNWLGRRTGQADGWSWARRATGPFFCGPSPDGPYAPAATFFSGSERMRLPVAAKMALAIAGAIGGVPGSPSPPHLSPPDRAK